MSMVRAIRALCASACFLAPGIAAADYTDEQAAELQVLRQRLDALEKKIATDAPLLRSEAPEQQEPSTLDRLEFSGDARYRAESIDLGDVDNDRQRVRARIGANVNVTETMMTAIRLSTGDGDPRSAHLTFSGGYSRRSVGIDLAYLQWSIVPELRVAAGKVPYPNWQPSGSVFIGGDFNPEGWSTAWRGNSGWFASAHHFWLQTRADAADSRQSGMQVGFDSAADSAARFKIAGAYTDFTEVRGQKPFLDGINPYGNSLDASGQLQHDFNIAELAAEMTLARYPGSITLFTHLAQNLATPNDDTAYSAGISVGVARLSNWRFGYQYARIEKDALFGQLMDGDFGGGATDTRGHAFRLAYRPGGRWSSSLSYLHNQVNISAPAALPFDLIQLDIDVSY